MLAIVLLELILVLTVGACVMLRQNSKLVFESILENEEQDLKFSVDNVIRDLDRQRRDLKAEGTHAGRDTPYLVRVPFSYCHNRDFHFNVFGAA